MTTEQMNTLIYEALSSESLYIPGISLTKAEAAEALELIRKHLSLYERRADMLTPSFIRNLITDTVIDVLLRDWSWVSPYED